MYVQLVGINWEIGHAEVPMEVAVILEDNKTDRQTDMTKFRSLFAV